MNARYVAYIISALVLLFAAFLMLLAGYWVFIEPDPLTMKNPQALKLNKTQYMRGEQLVYTVDYCRTKSTVNTISRFIVNGTRIAYDTVQSNLPVGCHTYEIFDLSVPTFMPVGKHHLEFIYELKVNPLRKDTINLRTVDFEVLDEVCPQIEHRGPEFGRAKHID